jgi:hypothetical protein
MLTLLILLKSIKSPPLIPTVEKKQVFLRMPFYADRAANSLKQSMNRVISVHFPAARPIVFLYTKFVPARSPKDRIPVNRSASVIYKIS